MKIFPAIDIKDKKCVRLVKGDFDNKTEYEMSPVDQAGKYKDHGFKNLHIVDLDGALTGETVNLDIIQEIVHKFDIMIEVGGGIRTIDGIEKYINVGVEKVILGSAAIKDKNFLKEACQKFQNKIALGLDAKDGYLSVSGWKENSNQLTLDYLKEVNDFGASRLIYTDINRDGMKQSPNFEETSKVAIDAGVTKIIKRPVEERSLREAIENVVGKYILTATMAEEQNEENESATTSVVERGQKLLALGDLEGAEEAFEEAMMTGGGSEEVFCGLAEVYLARGDKEAAEQVLAEAVRIDPMAREKFDARNLGLIRRGQEYMQKGKLDEAQDAFEDALLKGGELLEVYASLAEVHLKKNDKESAERAIAEAEKIDPEVRERFKKKIGRASCRERV